jgi:hypothetical protein
VRLFFTPEFVRTDGSGSPRVSHVEGSTPHRKAQSVLAPAEILHPTRDAAAVEEVVNHPDVLPFVGADGPLDLSDAVAKPENIFLIGQHGGFALIWSAPGVYEVHTFIAPKGRGKWAYDAAWAMIDAAREAGAHMLWTRIKPDMGNVAAFARHFGMHPTGQQIETLGHAYDVYKMEVTPCRLQP